MHFTATLFSSRTASSARWLRRQQKDIYVKQAQESGYNSRAAYKLVEINQVRTALATQRLVKARLPLRDYLQNYKILRYGSNVVDLGAAPGGWTQVRKTLWRLVEIDYILFEGVCPPGCCSKNRFRQV